MQKNLYDHIIATHQRNLLMLTLIFGAALAIAIVIFFPYLDAVKNPIVKVDYAQLFEKSSIKGHSLYEATANYDSEYTFQTAYMEEDTEVVLNYYTALLTDNDSQFVVADIEASIYEDETVTSYIGHFVPMGSELRTMLIEDLVAEGFTEDEATQMMPTVVFKVENNRTLYMVFAVGLMIGLLFFLRNLMTYIRRKSDVTSTTLHKSLAKLNQYEMLISELKQLPVLTDCPKLGITNQYVIFYQTFQVIILPIDDILWMHAHVTRHKAYYVVTVNKSFKLVIYSKTTKNEMPMTEKEVYAAIEHIKAAEPAIIAGYTDELQRLYSKSKQEMIDYVARQKIEARTTTEVPGSLNPDIQ